jgi:hypothetical protein
MHMTNFIQLIDRTADAFEKIIVDHSKHLREIHTDDFGWSNKRWMSTNFRMAHVERFSQPKFSVLHVVIFPHVMDPSAIFGFDIIASDTKATGVFFDFSPTILPSDIISDRTWKEPRERPSWGNIFSDHWIACRPSFEEAEHICEMACEKLKLHLLSLGTKYSYRLHDIVKAQNQYSLNQRQNEHTTRVILKLLGEERGKYFVNEILFPTLIN